MIIFRQFSKYFIVGASSAVIDFFMLNILSYFTGITVGISLGWINAPGAFLGMLNAYYWNSRWVFKAGEGEKKKGGHREFLLFAAVVTAGFFINSFALVFFTTYFSRPSDIHPALWLNIAKALATGIVVIWNFTGYKFLVFKK
ncbi:GtrA family protein [Candidatus Giovannonibacteria bacterium]|nr:GtrA family protein [Candidatus Giovannonibacteria bacterium]